jgi:N-acetylneuraminic acid mutarotase
LPASGPAAREDHTWTVDIDGRIAYLFGGREGGTVFGDLWAYDLETDAWAALETHPSPAARFGHEAAWVDGVGLVIFAGQAGSSFFNDLWAYDPDAGRWSELPAAGALPIARYGTCSVVGSDGRLWISHGFTSDGVRFDDTRAYDFPSGIWTDETPTGTRPAERCLHACWLTDDGDLVLYAGQTTGVPALGDQWTLAGGGWTQTAGRQPPERNLPAHLRLDSATLVFGGLALDLELLDDLWLLHDDGADAQALAPAGSSPAGRSGATLIRDSRRILLFGGRTADGASSELWVLTGMESQS